MPSSSLKKMPKLYNGEMRVSLINSVQKTRQPHGQEWNSKLIFYHTQNQLKMDQILECKTWDHKTSRKKISN